MKLGHSKCEIVVPSSINLFASNRFYLSEFDYVTKRFSSYSLFVASCPFPHVIAGCENFIAICCGNWNEKVVGTNLVELYVNVSAHKLPKLVIMISYQEDVDDKGLLRNRIN